MLLTKTSHHILNSEHEHKSKLVALEKTNETLTKQLEAVQNELRTREEVGGKTSVFASLK